MTAFCPLSPPTVATAADVLAFVPELLVKSTKAHASAGAGMCLHICPMKPDPATGKVHYFVLYSSREVEEVGTENARALILTQREVAQLIASSMTAFEHKWGNRANQWFRYEENGAWLEPPRLQETGQKLWLTKAETLSFFLSCQVIAASSEGDVTVRQFLDPEQILFSDDELADLRWLGHYGAAMIDLDNRLRALLAINPANRVVVKAA